MNKITMVMALAVTLAVSLIGVPSSMADEVERIDPSKEKGLKSPDVDTERVTLTIKNMLDSAISIHWLDDYDGARVHYHDIEPGKKLDRSTFPGHYWVIVDSGDKALGIYKTPDEAATITVKADELARIDPSKEKDLKSPEDTTRVTLTIKNTLDSAISIHWLDYDGARVYYHDIEPGKEFDRSTFPGHYWVIVDSNDKTLGIYKTPDKAATITVKTNEVKRIDPSKEKDLKSPEDTTRVTLTIKNTLDSAISIHWLDYNGASVYYHDIEPGKEFDRSTFPGHYWVIVDSNDKTLGIYETPNQGGLIKVK